jgi:hypothetical protein
MGLHTKKQFAEICGMKTKTLSIYIGRDKVVVGKKNLIDDSLPANKEFMLKYADQNQAKIDPAVKKSVAVITKGKVSKAKVPDQVAGDEPVEDDESGLYTLEKRKKALDIEKITSEISLLQLKEAKIRGEVVPTDLVKIVFTQHSKSISTAFFNAADNLFVHISKKANLNRNDQAELRSGLVALINKAVEESVGMSKKMLKNILEEYSQKRGVGERA